MNAPELSAVDIQREVEKLFGRVHRSAMTALYGRGEAGEFNAAGRQWEVIPTSCEMEMRAAMPKPCRDAATRGDGRVFLVDWTDGKLPLDLSCRLAAGMMFHVSRDSRLAGLFGARQTESGLMGSGLAAVLLAGEVTGLKKVSGILLTKHDATRHFLNAWAGFPLSERLTAASLAAWCYRSDVGSTLLQKASASDAWSRLGRELEQFVEHEGGPAAALVWKAFLNSSARRFIQIAVLVEAFGRRRDQVAEGVLHGSLADLAPGFGDGLLQSSRRLALGDLLEEIFQQLDQQDIPSLLDEADGLIKVDSFAAARADSRWLPAGHVAREQVLATTLDALVEQPKWETLNRVLGAKNELEAHALDRIQRTEEQLEARSMAVRLAAWLVERAQQVAPGPGVVYQPAVDHATAYAAEGGYVDWCRGRLRGPLPFAEELNEACHRVLKAADERRRADDKEFADALLEWHVAGKPSSQILPIEHVSRNLVADLLDGHPKRKALVVLMDGMSWTVAVQLLDRLENEQWAPILWRPKGSVNRAHLPPVLASLPTLTQVSRAAFFAGKATAKDGHRSTGEDAKRWASNKWLIRANDEAALPELILRSQLMDGEALHPEVRKAVDSDHAVVGVVVNAVDEELRGSTQVMRDYSRTVIKPLAGLINAAAGAERIVILASDHGHVLGDAMKSHGLPTAGKMEGGKRWRTVAEGESIHPFELELPNDVWRPKGAARVAAIWDETVCHSHPAYGEHGGLSLAEVVAPVLVLAPEWLAELETGDNSDLETRPFPIPAWWEFDVRPARAVKPTRVPKDKGVSEVQPVLPMPGMESVDEPPVVPSQHEEAPLVAKLRKSKVFLANTDGKPSKDVAIALEALSVLLEAGDSLSDREFARLCRTRPHRVAGLVARMGTVLNIDGYAVVEHDPAGHQVRLHRARLVAQYGLPK